MDRFTGKAIGRTEHIAQSIGDILQTPKGTRVMRRDYGVSYLFEDGSVRPGVSSDEVADEAATLLERYEPRLRVLSVNATVSAGILSGILVEYTDVENPDVRLTQEVSF